MKKRDRFRRSRIIFAVVMASAILLSLAPEVSAEELAVVRTVSGGAVYSRALGETELILKAGARLPSGSTIRTWQGTEIVVALPDSHVVTLGPAATYVQWNAGRLKTISITLFHGQSNHSVSRLSSDASYRVVTPAAAVGVRGTEFLVEAGENGASRTKVKNGEVMAGADETERALGVGDEAVESLSTVEDPGDGTWIEAQRVRDAEAAAAVEAAAAERMENVNRMTIEDLAEMASISRDIFSLVRRRPGDLGDIAAAVDILARGLSLHRRMELRKEGMTARRELARNIARAHGVSDANSDSQYVQYTTTRTAKAGGIDSFIDGLEKLSTLISLSRAVPGVPSVPGGGGFMRRVPFPF